MLIIQKETQRFSVALTQTTREAPGQCILLPLSVTDGSQSFCGHPETKEDFCQHSAKLTQSWSCKITPSQYLLSNFPSSAICSCNAFDLALSSLGRKQNHVRSLQAKQIFLPMKVFPFPQLFSALSKANTAPCRWVRVTQGITVRKPWPGSPPYFCTGSICWISEAFLLPRCWQMLPSKLKMVFSLTAAP